jgi:carbamoyltransferase
VAWFQGGSEFGPRSLGQRSILADPRSPHMKDHLNDRVKHREPFRPFAPAVLEERAPEFFDIGGPSPFMLRVVDVLPAQRDVIPAVTHVDGTARLQTVNAETHPAFHALISAFARITGVPVVLNTSFNVAGRPIVETPADAVDCYLKTAIDVLVLGDFMLVKEPEPVAAQAAATAAGSAS